MLLRVWTRDDQTGLLDGEYKRLDVGEVWPDSFPLGGRDKKGWFWVKLPDPPGGVTDNFKGSFERPDYNTPETSVASPPERNHAPFRLNYAAKFNGDQVAKIEDQQVIPGENPDGTPDEDFEGIPFVDGVLDCTATDGTAIFTLADIQRKG